MNGFILRRIDEHGIISLCRRHGRLTVEPNTQGIGKETGSEAPLGDQIVQLAFRLGRCCASLARVP
jgi:hypothetical protein